MPSWLSFRHCSCAEWKSTSITHIAQPNMRRTALEMNWSRSNDNYEKPFLQYWTDHDVIKQLSASNLTVLSGIDYTSFKLFHISIVFRASLSAHPNFSEVNLGPHEERMRKMLLKGDPGEPWQYLIVCMGIEGAQGEIWHDMVGPAHRVRYKGYWGYYFTFMGCQWLYYVGSHPLTDLERVALSQSGTLPVMVAPLKSISHYRDQRKRLKAT
jgi:hypothetical protein